MHKFYFTSNLGGGGTNVSRIIDYKQSFDLPNIGLLMNYYYLTLKCAAKFDTALLRSIGKYSSIDDFLNFGREYFAGKREVSESFIQDLKPTPINGYLLDNGSGNIVRDLLNSGRYNEQAIHDLIVPFHDFADNMQFDIAIALDYAMKYTYKDRENRQTGLMRLWKELAQNEEINLSLIMTTLKVIQEKHYTHNIYAPLHGFDYDSFQNYLERILSVEGASGTKFNGFALGGIADTKKLPNGVWGVNPVLKKDLKTGYIVSKLCKRIVPLAQRPVHVLGAGNIYVLPFIIKAGAVSSDCHSAWRRASDGGYEKAKILIPLLNDKLEFINNKEVLQYVKIKDLDDSYTFDIGYSISDIKRLYRSNNRKDYYFGEILAFYTAIKQYDLMIKFTEMYPDYLERLCYTPDREFNINYRTLADILQL